MAKALTNTDVLIHAPPVPPGHGGGGMDAQRRSWLGAAGRVSAATWAWMTLDLKSVAAQATELPADSLDDDQIPGPDSDPVLPARLQCSSTWPEWEFFRSTFISAEGRVVDLSSERQVTYSEGQSYALVFALVANDKATFDRLVTWTEQQLSGGDMSARLPAWMWGRRDDGAWGVLDANSASDSDLWIVFALAEAGRLWGVRRYQALAVMMAALVVQTETAELPGLGLTLLPGPKGFDLGSGRWRLNPSYAPMSLMRWLTTQGFDRQAWGRVAQTSLRLLLDSSPRGFAPDWIVYDVGQGFVPDLEGDEKGEGAYNAIRAYLWAGLMDARDPVRARLLQRWEPMARLVQTHGYPPESVNILTGGFRQSGSSGFTACLIPFLAVRGDTDALVTQINRLIARPVRSNAYYDQVLQLFMAGWRDGRYRMAANGNIVPGWSETC
jgi:endoglucanase